MKPWVAVVVGMVVLLGAVGQATADVAWWNGHKYESIAVPSWLNWYAAKNAAEAAGGYLATIHSESENQVVFGLVDSPEFWTVGGNPLGPWIGGYQPAGSPEPDGNWRWVTGEPWTYSNWDPGEPSNADGLENALSFVARSEDQRTDKWNDVRDLWVLPGYVVEHDIPEPSTLLLLSMGAVGLLAYAWRRRQGT